MRTQSLRRRITRDAELADGTSLGFINSPAMLIDYVATKLDLLGGKHELLGAQSNAVLPMAVRAALT